MYSYNEWQWILFFFCYCFFGWIFESSYVSLRKRHLVNRGFLRLPMLPLYGTGAVMMLFVSLPVKDNLILVYFSGVIAATLLDIRMQEEFGNMCMITSDKGLKACLNKCKLPYWDAFKKE